MSSSKGFYRNNEIDPIKQVADGQIETQAKDKEAIVANVDPVGNVLVRQSGSRNLTPVARPKSLVVQPGDRVLLRRLGASGSRMTITGVVGGSGLPMGVSSEVIAQALSAPSGLAATGVPGGISAQWEPPNAQADLIYELEVADDTDETNAVTYKIAGTSLVVSTTIEKFFRVRSMASDYQRSGWTLWTSAIPVDVISGSEIADTVKQYETAFNYATSSPIVLHSALIDEQVWQVEIIIDTVFDGTPSLTIGDTADNDRLTAAMQNLPTVLNTFVTRPNYQYGSATDIKLYITPGGATQGAGRAIVTTR